MWISVPIILFIVIIGVILYTGGFYKYLGFELANEDLGPDCRLEYISPDVEPRYVCTNTPPVDYTDPCQLGTASRELCDMAGGGGWDGGTLDNPEAAYP